jgi:hypothetical protein
MRSAPICRPLRLLGLGALLALATACSSAGGAGQPKPSAVPGSPAPSGWQERELGPVTFSAPAALAEIDTGPAADPDLRELALRGQDVGDGTAPAVLAQFAADPPRAAAAEADSLETVKRDVHRAQDVRRQHLALEGMSAAVVVSWTEPGPTGTAQRTDVLVADVAGGGLLTLTVKADAADFDADGLGAVARSAAAAGTRG